MKLSIWSKRVVKWVLSLVVVAMPFGAAAQMDIDDINLDGASVVRFVDSIRLQTFNIDYFSQARHRYEQRQVRNSRNTLEITGALQGGLTNLSDSWIETSGGNNSISMVGSINAKHTFKKDKFSLASQLIANFGYYRIMIDVTNSDGVTESTPTWYKNQDELQLSMAPSIEMTKNWSYGASIKFRSQFAKGYVSASSQEDYNLKSDFLSPGYLDLSAGFTYNCPKTKIPFKIYLSPVTLSATYVRNQTVRENSQFQYLAHDSANATTTDPYGVNYTRSSKYEGGSSIQIDFSRSWGKNDLFSYNTTLYTFYGWMTQLAYGNIYSDIGEYNTALEEWSSDEGVPPILSIHPVVRWENTVKIQATKLIATTLQFQIYYNRAQNLSVQTKTYLLVGLSYTFKNQK